MNDDMLTYVFGIFLAKFFLNLADILEYYIIVYEVKMDGLPKQLKKEMRKI